VTDEITVKLNACYQLLCEIRDKVSHCPNNGIKEVFDREFARDNASAHATFPEHPQGESELDRIKGIVLDRWGHWTDIHGPKQEQETQREET
jgi:hypothetical protein